MVFCGRFMTKYRFAWTFIVFSRGHGSKFIWSCFLLKKVRHIQEQMSRVEAQVPEAATHLAYWSKKAQIYRNLNVLSQVLDQYEDKLKHPDLTEMQTLKDNLAFHNDSLHHLKELGQETLLHPGALVDPGNTIKNDLYTFCERFETLETEFSEQHASLLKQCEKHDKNDVVIGLENLSVMESRLKSQNLSSGQEEILRDMIDRLKDHNDRIEAITLWMREVGQFLTLEDALFGDLEGLEAQVKDSNALVEDVATLNTKLDEVNESCDWLVSKCLSETDQLGLDLKQEREAVNDQWNQVGNKSAAQNVRLRAALDRSRKLMESLDEIVSFINGLGKDLPDVISTPIKKPTELSQRTFKLLHFKDKIEKKRVILESLLVLLESADLMAKATVTKIADIQRQWKNVCEPVIDSYNLMKVASTGKR